MNIRIYKCQAKSLKIKIKDIVIFSLNNLIENKRILNNISISVIIDNRVTKSQNAWGLCWWTDKNTNPRKFKIVLSDKTTKTAFITTLMHEMVHIKQYVNGDLKDFKSGAIKWKNQIFENEEKSPLEQQKLPWEKEAYELSDELYDIYSSM